MTSQQRNNARVLMVATITLLLILTLAIAGPAFWIAHRLHAEREGLKLIDVSGCGVSAVTVTPGPTSGTEIVTTQHDCDTARVYLHNRPTMALGMGR